MLHGQPPTYVCTTRPYTHMKGKIDITTYGYSRRDPSHTRACTSITHHTQRGMHSYISQPQNFGFLIGGQGEGLCALLPSFFGMLQQFMHVLNLFSGIFLGGNNRSLIRGGEGRLYAWCWCTSSLTPPILASHFVSDLFPSTVRSLGYFASRSAFLIAHGPFFPFVQICTITLLHYM